MKINTVTVRYGELRSTGYPAFSNRTCAIELTASLDSGDTAVVARDRLLRHAKASVSKMFTDAESSTLPSDCGPEMDVPF